MRLRTSTQFLLILFFFCCSAGLASAQNLPAKFGKVEESELTMHAYDKDTSAAAVVLSDYGYSYFTYHDGFKVNFERHTRIKILKKSGYDWANVTIPFYQKNGDKERISNIKGFTYNLEGGKMVKHKLESSSQHDEQRSENWYSKKFTMPNVKEGSVIEYSYTISSDFLYNLREWEFQTTIPVVWSEYKAYIPEYFEYKQQQQGYLPFDVATVEKGKERYLVTWSSEITPGINGGRTSGGSSQIEANSETFRWVVKEAPALRPEVYITTLSDYQSKIEFELQRVRYPNKLPQVMTGNWDDINRDLLQAERFGAQLNRKGFFKNEVAAIKAKHTSPEQQMAALHELVKNTVKWNGKYDIYTNGSLSKAFESRTGSAAEVNLLLTSMLQEAGLTAAPVLVSTREHGRPPLWSPMLQKFNYVLAHVTVGDKEYLLDATDPLLPAGMLPVRCLNGQGRLIAKENHRWVDLKPSAMYTKLFSGELNINEKGEMTGRAFESNGGYIGLQLRNAIKEDGLQKYAEKISKEIGNLKYTKPEFVNVDNLAKPVDIKYTLTSDGNGQANDVIYLNPMMGQGKKENPFKLEKRAYPVDLGAPIDETFVCRLTIPAGYEMEEAPKSAIIALPDNGGRFTYMVEKEGNTIQIMSKVNVSKPVFYAPEYESLKEFYNQIVAKHAEQIVLKKVAN
ncbi:DUF3857 domain-containing protein [Pontibacter ruber]|uniref:DUF3857 domain-containing protein n=1 Tax=Pontibacter ruber TaxID=1343895 RepID=A0ABW5D1W1_9BACT|nr:DUF3857 domain-containing protein [Pontibacter ruber]